MTEGELDGAVLNGFDQRVAALKHFEDAPPCSSLAARLPSKTTPSPRLMAARNSTLTRCRTDRADFAQQHAALGGAGRRDEHLVIVAAQPARRKAARKGELHFFDFPRREFHGLARHGGVDGLAIVPRDIGHVLRRLEPPFDLEGADARGDQFGDQGIGRQVLGAKQILLLAQVHVVAIAN